MTIERAVELIEHEIGKHLALSLTREEPVVIKGHEEVATALKFILATHPEARKK